MTIFGFLAFCSVLIGTVFADFKCYNALKNAAFEGSQKNVLVKLYMNSELSNGNGEDEELKQFVCDLSEHEIVIGAALNDHAQGQPISQSLKEKFEFLKKIELIDKPVAELLHKLYKSINAVKNSINRGVSEQNATFKDLKSDLYETGIFLANHWQIPLIEIVPIENKKIDDKSLLKELAKLWAKYKGQNWQNDHESYEKRKNGQREKRMLRLMMDFSIDGSDGLGNLKSVKKSQRRRRKRGSGGIAIIFVVVLCALLVLAIWLCNSGRQKNHRDDLEAGIFERDEVVEQLEPLPRERTKYERRQQQMTHKKVNAAMAIDLGSEFMKMALIKDGVPMETVLNRDSQRKTPMALTIKDGERFLGDAALKKALVRPKNTYTFFLDLVGKKMDDKATAQFQAQFPYFTIKPHPKRGTVQFETDVGDMSVECALGMVLWNARAEVEAAAGHAVRDAVVTVPSYFGQVERAAVEAAAKIADLNLLQLLGSGTAAGLNYGVFRHKEITQPQTLLIYDVGSTKTLVTIVQFRVVNESKEGSSNSYPQVETIGVGYDRALGGHHLTLRLREHLVKAFKQQYPKLEGDITKNPQAMAKLLKEADRVKQVLSANPENFAHVESVFEDRDFRTKVTRDELEALFRDFEPRYLDPITVALRMADLKVEQLDRVVLMGAGTRMLRLQTILGTYFQGKELSKQLNTDEAIVLGAVYQAARLSKRFTVKYFEVKDLVPTENIGAKQLKKTALDEEEIKEAKRILNEFERNERAKMEHALALNMLESTVYDYSAKLEDDSFSSFGTAEELQLINEQMAKMKDWLDDMPDETDVEELKQKRHEVVAPIQKLNNRKHQKENRPALMEKLATTLDEAEKKLQLKKFFTEGELVSYQHTIEIAKAWFVGINKELEHLKDNQDATFTTDDLKTKKNALVGEMRTLDSKHSAAVLKQKEKTRRQKRQPKRSMPGRTVAADVLAPRAKIKGERTKGEEKQIGEAGNVTRGDGWNAYLNITHRLTRRFGPFHSFN
uniref:Hypoxia up-regulated protein 1 n=1 Tax=Globodera rostochiensis TaxID=31243 RepID=A0A914I6H6_GLORO